MSHESISLLIRSKLVRVALGVLAFLLLFVKPAHAEHGDWLLGTDGLLSAQQAPEGILYQNLWSYYHASGNSFLQAGAVKCGPRGKLCLGFNANGNGSLDLFVDQNVFWLVTPYKLLGANYGFLIDVPFAIADASGDAALEPVLSSGIGSVTLASLERSSGTTKGTIGDIYFEPIDLGWHLRQLDAIVCWRILCAYGRVQLKRKLEYRIRTLVGCARDRGNCLCRQRAYLGTLHLFSLYTLRLADGSKLHPRRPIPARVECQQNLQAGERDSSGSDHRRRRLRSMADFR